MNIVIPSMGRAHSQESLKHLRAAGLFVTIVVPYDEYDAYKHHVTAGVLVVAPPPGVKGIADTRQWMLDNVGKDAACIMVDDDLVFSKRRRDDPTKLEDITPEELRDAFYQLEDVLITECPHAGFACREGANRVTDARIHNTRILRVLGYNRLTLANEYIAFGRTQVMEDFDVALRLLRAGYPNTVLNLIAHNQKASGAAGGCSTYRTPQVQEQAALALAELHPGYVKVVTKETKTAWGGGVRTDVNIQWKKAYHGK